MTRVVLAASASVSVYKACDLASRLTQDGHTVRAVLTARAAALVSPQLFEAVTGQAAYTSEFDATRRTAMDHIELARWAQALLVAPCSADLAARLAHGLADDLVTTTALALPSGVPRFLCPAMNPEMLAHPAVARNLAQLVEDGWRMLEPESGHMACGVEGRGRLPDPARIAAWLKDELGR
jgi:phosphopantothenoylcysteine decarboxylase/phosphopantothenate--cysteine ligase